MIALGTYTSKATQLMMDRTTTLGYGSQGHDRAPDRPCMQSDTAVTQLGGGQITRPCEGMNLPALVEAAGGPWA